MYIMYVYGTPYTYGIQFISLCRVYFNVREVACFNKLKLVFNDRYVFAALCT